MIAAIIAATFWLFVGSICYWATDVDLLALAREPQIGLALANAAILAISILVYATIGRWVERRRQNLARKGVGG